MNRAQVLEQLARTKPELVARHGVTSLALIGATARDSARADSGVDILVVVPGTAFPPMPCSPS